MLGMFGMWLNVAPRPIIKSSKIQPPIGKVCNGEHFGGNVAIRLEYLETTALKIRKNATSTMEVIASSHHSLCGGWLRYVLIPSTDIVIPGTPHISAAI